MKAALKRPEEGGGMCGADMCSCEAESEDGPGSGSGGKGGSAEAKVKSKAPGGKGGKAWDGASVVGHDKGGKGAAGIDAGGGGGSKSEEGVGGKSKGGSNGKRSGKGRQAGKGGTGRRGSRGANNRKSDDEEESFWDLERIDWYKLVANGVHWDWGIAEASDGQAAAEAGSGNQLSQLVTTVQYICAMCVVLPVFIPFSASHTVWGRAWCGVQPRNTGLRGYSSLTGSRYAVWVGGLRMGMGTSGKPSGQGKGWVCWRRCD